MSYRIFLAGVSGAIGSRLTPLLHSAGHFVCGSTRSKAKADALRSLGADPVVVDVFDATALSRAVAAARPDVVIHQLTDFPKDLDRVRWAQRSFAPPASVAKERGTSSGPPLRRVRTGRGAKHRVGLCAGGRAARRDRPARCRGRRKWRHQRAGADRAGRLTLKSPPLEGVVLRYGQLYGPGTSSARPSIHLPIHVDAAAYAALLAIDHGDPGIYNIAQSNSHVTTEKARVELGWTPDFRLPA